MGDFQAIARMCPTSERCKGCPRTDRQAEQFVDFYYKTFDSDRSNLAALYVRHLEHLNLAVLFADFMCSATSLCSPSKRNRSRAPPVLSRSSAYVANLMNTARAACSERLTSLCLHRAYHSKKYNTGSTLPMRSPPARTAA